MKVLISGAAGLIGTALSQNLKGDGHEVVALVRPGAKRPGVSWDPENGQIDVDSLLQHGPFDAVVHLAGFGIGEKRWNEKVRREINDSREKGTAVLANALISTNSVPKVFVSGSAVGFYGNRGDEIVDEHSASGTGFLAQVCRNWESAASPLVTVTRVVYLRTGVVLSKKGGALAKQLPLFKLGLGGALGNGRQWLSWIHIDDEIGAIRTAITDPNISGPLNATAPNPATNAEFTKELAKALHRLAIAPAPSLALKAVLGKEMAEELLLASTRVAPKALEASGYRFSHPTLSGALADLLQ